MPDPLPDAPPPPAAAPETRRPDPRDEATRRIAAQFIAALPQAGALGLKVEAIGEGVAVIAMPYDPRLIGDPRSGVIHGGAVSTLMDTASGASVMCHPSGPASTATIDLRIDYMRPATPGQTIRARAECHHVTRSVAFVRVVATDDDAARPVAIGNGAFTAESAAESVMPRAGGR